MQPAITAMSSALLLACFMGAASAGGVDHSRQPVLLPDTPLPDAGVPSREVFNITLFEWMYDKLEDATHLMICTDASLLLEGEQIKTNPTLLYQMNENQTTIEGIIDGNQSCSLFTQEGRVRLSKSETRYLLILTVTNTENYTIQRSGNVKFGMPVDTSTIYCHDQPYTRASGLGFRPTINFDHPCISDSLTLGNDVCYLEGEFSSTTLCYTVDGIDLRVCLQGSSEATAGEVDGLSISYLAYKGVTSLASAAHLSLEFNGHDQTRPMEALIWKQDRIFATSCSATTCPIPDFQAGFARYDVCAVAFTDDLPFNTSTSSITDLNAGAVVYNSSPLLQFDYTNANERRFYIAYVVDKPDKNVTVDCSGVPSNRTCRGYFEETCTANLNVAVEYADDAGVPMGNKIMFPCQLKTGGRS